MLAHNLARWAARIGLGEQLVTTKTLRRRFFSMAGRLTHHVHILEMNGERYRLKRSRESAAFQSPDDSDSP